jgi:hypothetical protein
MRGRNTTEGRQLGNDAISGYDSNKILGGNLDSVSRTNKRSLLTLNRVYSVSTAYTVVLYVTCNCR